MKNTATKKLVSGLIIASILAIIGAVFVTADTGDDAGDTDNYQMPFHGMGRSFGKINDFTELTEEQQAEIDELITSHNEEGASCEEIRDAVSQKLDEWGILDERLDNAIEHTEQRLEILNRKNDLRDQGYSWDEINEIISEEYDLEYPTGIDNGMMRGCGKGRGFGWHNDELHEGPPNY